MKWCLPKKAKIPFIQEMNNKYINSLSFYNFVFI